MTFPKLQEKSKFIAVDDSEFTFMFYKQENKKYYQTSETM